MTSDNHVTGLKPCPVSWCRQDDPPHTWQDCTDEWVVICPSCGVNGPTGNTEAEAIEAWNACQPASPQADPWQKGTKIRWARQLDRRPLAVVGLGCVTIASRFAPLSVTLQECPGVFPLGWFDIVPSDRAAEQASVRSPDEVERVARAISIPEHHTTWDSLSEAEKNLYRAQADYAIAALNTPAKEMGE